MQFIFSGESAGFLKRPIIQISSSQIEVSSASQQKVVIRNTHGENLVGILHEAGSCCGPPEVYEKIITRS